jgi:hypothetical protein
MGQHSSIDDTLAAVESDAVRVKAAALAGQMTDWLASPVDPFPMAEFCKLPSDLVEWCRSARDVMEAVARG